jgi:hypothetical protein
MIFIKWLVNWVSTRDFTLFAWWRIVVGVLVGEIAYEAVRFIIMLALLVLAVFVGGKLRKAADAKKAAKMAASENKEKEITE